MKHQTLATLIVTTAVLGILGTCGACVSLEDAYTVTPAEAASLLEAAEAVYERLDEWDGPDVDPTMQSALQALQAGLGGPETEISIAGLAVPAWDLVERHHDLLEWEVVTGGIEYELGKAYLIDGNALLYGLQMDPPPTPEWVVELTPAAPSGPYSSIHEADIWEWEIPHERAWAAQDAR